MKYKVFVDGGEGTTGLKIMERFKERDDIEVMKIPEELRKDTNERKKYINSSDFTFLCLPDAAAKEAVSLCENDNVRIIDASTAHRTNPDWAYGIPELSEKHREKIKNSKRVSVPGCYASGFAALIYPLVEKGVIPKDFYIYCHAVSGYSGAGKSAIAQYEGSDKPKDFFSPRCYALTQEHKHIPEMQKNSGLLIPPVFNPIIDDYFCGMLVNIPIHIKQLPKLYSYKEIEQILAEHYENQKMIRVEKSEPFIAANELADKDYMKLFVNGNDERLMLTAQLDNLGKGASGAAVQCMNIMMGINETTGLNL